MLEALLVIVSLVAVALGGFWGGIVWEQAMRKRCEADAYERGVTVGEHRARHAAHLDAIRRRRSLHELG